MPDTTTTDEVTNIYPINGALASRSMARIQTVTGVPMATLDLKKTAVRCVDAVPAMRNSIIFARSLNRQPAAGNWLRFAMYHEVAATERADLRRQLRYLDNVAEFISVDDALDLCRSTTRPDGRYVCVTFDDGFSCSYTNAMPVLQEFRVPAAFFVIPGYIEGRPRSMRRLARNNNIDNKTYLTWAQCTEMADAGMTIGSHTFSHVNLADLAAADVEDELTRSKQTIAERIGRQCEHFAAPWGQPDISFLPDRDPALARKVGYKSFFTTVRGAATSANTPHMIPRERVEPSWGDYHLKFFLSQG